MVVRLSKVPFGYIVKGLKPIIMILMLTVLFQLFLTRGGATLVHWWIFTITRNAVAMMYPGILRNRNNEIKNKSVDTTFTLGSSLCNILFAG